jgi:hypothetical protein
MQEIEINFKNKTRFNKGKFKMVEHNDEYKEVEEFIEIYVNHELKGLAAFRGILEYAQYIDKIDYNQAKQLLYDFVGRMFLPEDYD